MGRKQKKKVHKTEISSDILKLIKDTEDISEIIEYSKNSDASVRAEAIKAAYPYKFVDKVDEYWNRVFEMAEDEDPAVRETILHTISNFPPHHLESELIEALTKLSEDSDKNIKKRACKVLETYYKYGGTWAF
jgi:HEAT repeat protein